VRSRRVIALVLVIAVIAAAAISGGPYLRSFLLVVRAANLGGRVEAFANQQARAVSVRPTITIPTRHGAVTGRLYEPSGGFTRTVLLIPGIHAAGIDEPRLTALAGDLAGSGVAVMTMALPDLRQYRVTPACTDIIEDAIAYLSQQPTLAPDHRIGIVGVSFSGGLSVVAAGRPSVRDRVAFVVSFGGHADLPRVMRYLCTGQEPPADGVTAHPPHDYGVAVVLYGMTDSVVPRDQVDALRDGVRTFLLASQQALVDTTLASATFARARDIATRLPEPSSTYLTYVNDRNTKALGAVLEPHLSALRSDDPSLSAERAGLVPTAPVFLLHGSEDTVIPAAESVFLSRYLAGRIPVRLLLSHLITHAEANKGASAMETWRLVSFWANVLKH
jgi:pimeloyl-ACP methyl ester carboxylesterase